ncbi:neurogenic locus notch-like protein 3-like isoform X2 [Gossypium australe]|uniref:Neurogenic locus notch-like protein 3-like isoform X2 n=1 Tax=Gossypium australe TaxID=47621 RepID=A0A5B6VGU6_9ROSI|nr:neurogenic locus notch-like protein 3-like isoform X2 [Gossypium australe]
MKLYANIYVFIFLLLLSFLRSSEADFEAFNSKLVAVNACAIVNCGQGTCRETGGILISFECDCYPGWTKISTLNFGCGESPSSPPPPPPPLPSWALNLSDPCTFTWCGDGSCKANGTGYECDCNEGDANLLANPTLPCFKECTLGGDCHNVWLGPRPPPSPPPLRSSSHGLRALKGTSKIKDSLKTLIFLVALIHQWL